MIRFHRSSRIRLFQDIVLLLLRQGHFGVGSIKSTCNISTGCFFHVKRDSGAIRDLYRLIARATISNRVGFRKANSMLLVMEVDEGFRRRFYTYAFRQLRRPRNRQANVIGETRVCGISSFTTYVISGEEMMSAFPGLYNGTHTRVNSRFIVRRPAPFTVENRVVVARTGVRSAVFRNFRLVACLLAGSINLVRTIGCGRGDFRSFFSMFGGYLFYFFFLGLFFFFLGQFKQ